MTESLWSVLWSWSDEGGRLTEKERVYCTGKRDSYTHDLLSLFSISVCLLLAFTVLLITVFITLLYLSPAHMLRPVFV